MRLTEPVVSIAAVIILLCSAAVLAIAGLQIGTNKIKPTTQQFLDCVNILMWQRHSSYYI